MNSQGRICIFILALMLLAACTSSVKPTSILTEVRTDTRITTVQVRRPTSMVHNTIPTIATVYTPTATLTLRSTSTQTAIPTLTATYDPVLQKTITPAPSAACPQVNAEYQPIFADQLVDGAWFKYDLSLPLRDALNQGASLSALKRAVVRATMDGKPAEVPPDALYTKDLTGDGVPEIIFSHYRLIIYTCQAGKYVEALHLYSSTSRIIKKEIIADMNRDGLQEIVTSINEQFNFVSNNYFYIYRWNGNEFVDLIGDQDITIMGFATWEALDKDRNGTLEFIVRLWEEISFDDRLHGPWRYKTYTYTWNGNTYVLLPVQLDPPEYRFQAVQDGDRAMRRKAYVDAVTFFRQAIEEPNLKGWGYSEEDMFQRQEALDAEYQRMPTPTPLPLDPNEKPTLIAYAHFRLVLAYTVLGNQEKAQQEYKTLQKEFPPGTPGSAYAELAKTFWESHQRGDLLHESCQTVMDYVYRHEAEVLEPLNNYSSGFQNISYDVEDLCLP